MIDVVKAIDKSKEKKIEVWPVRSNRASEIGHPCLKYLVLLRLRWNERTLHDVGLQYIFDDGHVHEKAIVNDIIEAGLGFEQQQRPYELKAQQITGHIDGKVSKGSEAYPCEIKSVNPWDWERIPGWIEDPNGWRQMLEAKKVWLRKWPFQLMTYLYMDNTEQGIMLLKNKLISRPKQIVINLDYEMMEALLQKAELINDYVSKEKLPPEPEYQDWICERCPFLHICLPDIDFGKGMELEDNPELEQMLEVWMELKPKAKECDETWKTIKKKVEGKTALIGDFQIGGKWQGRAGYTKEVGPSKFWVPKIVKVK